jgi:hypothetical protein
MFITQPPKAEFTCSQVMAALAAYGTDRSIAATMATTTICAISSLELQLAVS